MTNIKKTGFSLVELLIAMVISLTLIFACASVYSSLKRSILVSQGLSTAQESLSTAHYLMSRSVRQGDRMQLSGANPTREVIVTYGSNVESNVIYGCLGNQISAAGDTDTFKVIDNHLYCISSNPLRDEPIALDVLSLSASLTTNNRKGVDINLAIKGMPTDMETNGFTFSLAMRQRILIDSDVSNASATSVTNASLSAN